MQYFLIFILSMTIIQSASAARAVPGKLPSTTPLQPLPQDTAPNYKGSIDFSLEPKSVVEENLEQNRSQIPLPASKDTEQSSLLLLGRQSKLVWLVVIGFFGLILLYGILRFRSKK